MQYGKPKCRHLDHRSIYLSSNNVKPLLGTWTFACQGWKNKNNEYTSKLLISLENKQKETVFKVVICYFCCKMILCWSKGCLVFYFRVISLWWYNVTKHFLSYLLYSGHANYDALSFANNVRGDYCEMVQKRRLVNAFICNLVMKVEVWDMFDMILSLNKI